MSIDAPLGILFVGFGAVASTVCGGIELVRRGMRPGFGCLSELGSWPLSGDPEANRIPLKEALELLPLENLRFAGMDVVETDALEAAKTAGVLEPADLSTLASFFEGIPLFPGLFSEEATPGLEPRRVLATDDVGSALERVRNSLQAAMAAIGCERGLVVLSCSTETRALEKEALLADEVDWERRISGGAIRPSLIYARAALECGYPFLNLTPNRTLEHPVVTALAEERGLPVAGSDLKSGQTYMKTLIASGLQFRLLNVRSWFSTNILGNRDGQVLENQRALEAKKETKGRALEELLNPAVAPGLYESLFQLVHIHYFPPKGDNKEAWDSIQLEGWLGYPMELKIHFQCRDSILAAPLVVDLIRFTELAWRKGAKGRLDWLACYFKSPVFRTPELAGRGHHFIYQAHLLEEGLKAFFTEAALKRAVRGRGNG